MKSVSHSCAGYFGYPFQNQDVVQRFTVVDNSYFSPAGLTALSTPFILASQGALHASHFQQRGF